MNAMNSVRYYFLYVRVRLYIVEKQKYYLEIKKLTETEKDATVFLIVHESWSSFPYTTTYYRIRIPINSTTVSIKIVLHECTAQCLGTILALYPPTAVSDPFVSFHKLQVAALDGKTQTKAH